MELNRTTAELELEKAGRSNPGPWVDHSRYVAEACRRIAARCDHLSEEKAYLYGLLHDIGRYPGVTSERHLLDGYRLCKERGWDKAAQICISHAFVIKDISSSIGVFDMPDKDYKFMEQFIKDAVYDDYDRLIQLCDCLALPTGFCLLEKRLVDVALRYGTPPPTVPRWKKVLEIKDMFENKINGSIYDLLPGVIENTFYNNSYYALRKQ
ncbi:MAG: HD domain-containing protein [Eubacteriales bacterium]|nr:HD domain-containing protein [Eubacteriales bacterium]